MVHMLRDMKSDENPPVLSYFTQGGKILVRTSEDRNVKLVEIPIGVTKDQVRDLCKRKRVEVSSLEIRNQFRLTHSGAQVGGRRQYSDSRVPKQTAGAVGPARQGGQQ